MEKQLWTRTELAEAYGVTPHAVDKWRREGKVLAVRTPGGRVRFYVPRQLRAVSEERE